MNLSRLQELSGLLAPARVYEAEKPTKTPDFHGILDYVNDSLADLDDALGKSGTLSKLAKGEVMTDISATFAAFKKKIEKLLTDVEVDIMAGDAEKVTEAYHEDKDLKKPIHMIRRENGQEKKAKATLHHDDPDRVTYSYDDEPEKKLVTRKHAIGKGKPFDMVDRKTNESIVLESRLVEAKDYSDSGEFTDELADMGTHILKMKQVSRQPRWTNWMQVTDDNYSTSAVALNKDFTRALSEVDTAFNALENELHNAE